MKILVLRFSSLGDIVLTTSVLRFLKRQYPQGEIHYATKEAFKDVLEYNPNIDKLLLLNNKVKEKNEKQLIDSLKKNAPYDIIIDLHSSLRSYKICKLVPSKKVSRFRKPYFRRFLLVNLKINLLKKYPDVTTRYLLAASMPFDEASLLKNKVPNISIPKALENRANFLPKQEKNIILSVAMGSQWFTKKWPTKFYAQTIRQIDKELGAKLKIILLGAENEVNDAKGLSSLLPKSLSGKVDDRTGKLSILETASIIKNSHILLCNDSGLMHIAACFNTKIFGIFLSTVPELGFLPPSNQFTLIQERVHCAPCTTKGKRQCPKKHFLCAKNINPDTLSKTIIAYIKKLSIN